MPAAPLSSENRLAPLFLLGVPLDQAFEIIRQAAPFFGRRFPPPWSVEVTPNCFIVRDANGQALAYVVYFEDEPGRRSAAGPQDGLGSAHSYPFGLFGELHR